MLVKITKCKSGNNLIAKIRPLIRSFRLNMNFQAETLKWVGFSV